MEASHNELTRLRGLAMRVANSAEDLKEDIEKLNNQRKLEAIEKGILFKLIEPSSNKEYSLFLFFL